MANTAGLIDIKLRAGFDKGAMNTAQREVGKNMQLMANRSKQAGMAINSTIAMSILPFGAALAGAFGFGAAAAVKFEEQFAAVKKTLDVAGEGAEVEAAFQGIARQLRNIAKVSPASIQELTQIAAVGGQLGIAAADIVTFTDTIQKLTVATNMGAEDAAMALARLQKITNLASSDIDNLGSVIVRLGNNFATTESEIVTAATQIATATAGIQTEFNNAAVDAIAFATALRAVGQPAQAGSTAIIRLIQVIKRLNMAGGDQLKTVAMIAGTTVEEFQGLFEIDPSRGLALFIEGLGEFEKKGGDVTGVLKELNLDTLRTSRALMALARAEGEGGLSLIAEALGMANTEFTENTALLTEAERRYETVASQLKILRNIVNENAISFGEQFLPQINNFVFALGNLITSLSNLEGAFDFLKKGLITFATLAIPASLIQATRAITANTMEYAVALEFARNKRTALTAEEQRGLFGKGSTGPGGLIFNPNVRSGMFGQRSQRMEPRGNMLQGPTFGGGALLNELAPTTERMTPAFRQTNEALKKLSKQAGVTRLRFLLQNRAFKDAEMFTENMNTEINKYNNNLTKTQKASGKAIASTNALRGGFIGLASATRALGMAMAALVKSFVVFAAISGVITLVTKFFERRGAAKRSFETFADGLGTVTEGVQELAQAEQDLQALQKSRDALGDEDSARIDAFNSKIKEQTTAIAGLQAQIDKEAGGILQKLLFGQKGGKGLQNQLSDAAELADLDVKSFTDNVFESLSSIVTDIETGKTPTIGDLVNSLAGATTGDTNIDETLKRLDQEFGLLEVMRKNVRGNTAFSKVFGVDEKDAKQIRTILKGYEEIIELTTDSRIEDIQLEDAFESSAVILDAKGEYLNNVQKLLISQGTLQDSQYIDAKKAGQFNAAQLLVTETIDANLQSSSDHIKDFEDGVMAAEFTMVELARTIDDTIQGHMDNAMNALNKLPEAARITAIEYSNNLIENLAIANEFEDLINKIASDGSMLLAKNLAEQGVAAINVARDFANRPLMASEAEELLMGSVNTELALQAVEAAEAARKEAELIANAVNEGIVDGLVKSAPQITQALEDSIIDAVEGAEDYLDIENPSRTTRDKLGIPMAEGVAQGIKDSSDMLQRSFIATVKEAIQGVADDFNIYTEFTNAQRAIVTAQQGEIRAQQTLNKARRDAASITDRLAKAQKDLARAEIEGRAGNITIDEEIGLLRQKISLEQKIKDAGGNKSAREMLQIQKAEENIADLRAMASKGVISNLELQAAEEELASMKGTDITADERQLMILELAQAEKQLEDARTKALEIDDNLVSLRERVIQLTDENALVNTNLTIAENGLAVAKERVIDADIKLDTARNKMNEAMAYDGSFMTNLRNLNAEYGTLGVNMATVTTNNNLMVDSIVKGVDKVIEAYKKLSMPMGMTLSEAVLSGMMGSGEYNMFKQGLIGDGMKMGGRVKGYKYGGRGDPMTRALVGEYGPEEVRFVPGSGFLVKPLGTGSSGTVVNSLNVNVTGVPSDPISARKAAVQISKALRKLDKEGSSGTGLRRN